MKEHPILFSTPMVQAILEGRKTMTRRIIDPQPEAGKYPQSELDGFYWKSKFYLSKYDRKDISLVDNSRFGQPGDLLWVRETWIDTFIPHCVPVGGIYYKADHPEDKSLRWRPSIHMPKSAARIWLQVEEIRVERLQDITEEDAIAEGIEQIDQHGQKVWKRYDGYNTVTSSPIVSFWSLWVSINGEESWDANPWVWVVKDKVLSTSGKPQLEILNLKPETAKS